MFDMDGQTYTGAWQGFDNDGDYMLLLEGQEEPVGVPKDVELVLLANGY